MSKGHTACFKHLMADCNCDSPKKLFQLHHSVRVPSKGNLNDWKKFLDFILTRNYRGAKPDLTEIISGTRLETYLKNKMED